MTPNEHNAYLAGLKTAATLAQAAAVGIETHPGAEGLRQRSAVAALRELSDTIRAEIETTAPSPAVRAMWAIAKEEDDRGEIECPMCKGRLQWARVGPDRHVHASCETPRCLSVMQ